LRASRTMQAGLMQLGLDPSRRREERGSSG
jgi:hypothetical protein